MAVTDTGSLADSKQLIIDSARIVREYEGVWSRTCDVQRLEIGRASCRERVCQYV